MDSDNSRLPQAGIALRDVRGRWALMTIFDRFEQLVAIALRSLSPY